MQLDVLNLFEARKKMLLIDVRTPAEFIKGHIPGAFNIPLLDDRERAEVGTLYKNKGRETAFLRALELSGPKMAEYVREIKELADQYQNDNLLVHCWRGGMRSAGMGWLFNMAGYNSVTLEKGYKAYRNLVLTCFDRIKRVCVLGGYTGSGKTEILKYLSAHFQTSDLEKFAHHKGSAFGFIGETSQPSTEQFENDLADEWYYFDTEKPVWVEDESRTIGSVYLPDNLYSRIRNSTIFFIDMPKDLRIKRLVQDYAVYDKELLRKAIDKISVRLGGQNHKTAIQALGKDDFETVADIALSYYDKTYLYGLGKRDQSKVVKIPVNTENAEENAVKVEQYFNAQIS